MTDRKSGRLRSSEAREFIRVRLHTSEVEYIPFEDLRFHHSILSNPEYCKLFRASGGVQYPVLKECISELKEQNDKWSLECLSKKIDDYAKKNTKIRSYLDTMSLRIDEIVKERELMSIINSTEGIQTIQTILQSNKKVIILDLQVSNDLLDIVVFLLFKVIYEYKKNSNREVAHLSFVLEEAHRYINRDSDESRLGNYYIDKIAREGRKFGIGLIIASQIPSMLSYQVISQCNSIIMHKITSKQDMEFLRGVLRVSNETFYLQMSALDKQYAIVCGEAFLNDSIVKIYDANPLPMSNDPLIKESGEVLGIQTDKST